MSRSKGSLETLGFASLSLSETVAFVDFPSLPEVWAHVEHEVSGGQARQSVTILPTQLGKATEEPREQP